MSVRCRLAVRALLSATSSKLHPAARALPSSVRSAASLKKPGKSEIKVIEALKSELDFENGDAATSENKTQLSALKSSFLKRGFKVEDRPGSSEVCLTRQESGEKIQVFFSLDDLEDSTFENNQDESERKHGDSKNHEADDGEDNDQDDSVSVNASITITKAGTPGALTFHVMAEDAKLYISNVVFSEESEIALKETAEADYMRRGQYTGPVFDHLEPDLQSSMMDYLASRGIDDGLAGLLPEYLKAKEQDEYHRWLGHLHGFFNAK